MTHDPIIQAVRDWVEKVVIGLNLCPFAKREFNQDRIRFVRTMASTQADLLSTIDAELTRLEEDQTIETTLLIHPQMLQNFLDYNDFLNAAETLIFERGLEGVYQIASFHPDYQFAGTDPEDAENYTNRSPYPLLHLLREESLASALARYPDPENIPTRNIALMEEMGREAMRTLLTSCHNTTGRVTPTSKNDPHSKG